MTPPLVALVKNMSPRPDMIVSEPSTSVRIKYMCFFSVRLRFPFFSFFNFWGFRGEGGIPVVKSWTGFA